MNDILAQAIRRGFRSRIQVKPPIKAIPIKQIEETVSVPINVVEKPVSPPEPVVRYPTVHDVGRAVARHFGLELAHLASARRMESLIWPRHIACYLARELTIKSYPEIGRVFGGRDHTTIMHAAKKIAQMLADGDEVLRADVEAIKQKLNGAPEQSD